MAVHRISILGAGTMPDATGEAWFEPANTAYGTNNLGREMLLRLGSSNAAQPTVKHGIYGSFRVPKNYVSAPVVVVEWTATVTSGDVVFAFDYNSVGGDAAESFDPAAWQQSLTVTDTVSATARRKSVAGNMSITAANLAVDDILQFYLSRDGTAGGDTMAGSAWVMEATFEYADV